MERRPALRLFSGEATRARFSPDGSQFAMANGKTVTVRDLDGKVVQTLGPFGHRVRSIAWSFSGKEIVCGTDRGTAELWEFSDSQPNRKWQIDLKHGLPVQGFVYLHNGNKLAVCSNADVVQVLDPGTGRILEEFRPHKSGVFDIAYHADKKLVATAGANGEALVWKPDDGSIQLRLKGHRGYVTAVCWSPSGDRLATGGDSGEVIVWDAASGERLQRLDGQTRRVTSLEWSPDGKRIAGGGLDFRIHLWNPKFEDELTQLEFNEVQPERLHWSANGNQLVAAGELGAVLLDAGQRKVQKIDD